MLPESVRSDANNFLEYRPQILSGFHRSVRAMREAGNNIIVDHVLRGREWLMEVVNLFAEYDVLFVGIHCPLEILEQRERERRDRQSGLARQLYYEVHADCIYDVELDTFRLSAEECANQILACTGISETPRAFSRIREKLK